MMIRLNPGLLPYTLNLQLVGLPELVALKVLKVLPTNQWFYFGKRCPQQGRVDALVIAAILWMLRHINSKLFFRLMTIYLFVSVCVWSHGRL